MVVHATCRPASRQDVRRVWCPGVPSPGEDVHRWRDVATVSVRVPGAALLCLCFLVGMVAEVAAARVDAVDVAGAGSADIALTSLRSSDRRILAGLPATTTVGIHAGTGRVRFLGARPAAPLMRAATLRRVARSTGLARSSERVLSPATAARAFLSRTATLFGVADPARDLTVERTEGRGALGSVVRFAQTRGGIPVLGGELLVRLDRRGAVVAATGEALPAGDRVDDSRSHPRRRRTAHGSGVAGP